MKYAGFKKFCLVHTKKNNKMPLSARLIYSLLVYRAVYDKGLTVNGIAERLHMNRCRSVAKWLKWLEEQKMVINVGGEWFALQGSVDQFSYKSSSTDAKGKPLSWCQRMAKITLCHWVKGIPLTSSQIVLYFLLVNFAERQLMGRATIRNLSRLLGVDRVTTRSGLRKLVTHGLIKIGNTITVNEMTETHKAWFTTDKKNVNRKLQYLAKQIEVKEQNKEGYTVDNLLMEKEVEYFIYNQLICKKSEVAILPNYLITDLYKAIHQLKHEKPKLEMYQFSDLWAMFTRLKIKPDVDDLIIEDKAEETVNDNYRIDSTQFIESTIQTKRRSAVCIEDDEDDYEQ